MRTPRKFSVCLGMNSNITSHVNTLDALCRTTTHGTRIYSLRAPLAHTHVKTRNYCMISHICVTNATCIQCSTHWATFGTLVFSTNMNAMDVRGRCSGSLHTRIGLRSLTPQVWTVCGWGCTWTSSMKLCVSTFCIYANNIVHASSIHDIGE